MTDLKAAAEAAKAAHAGGDLGAFSDAFGEFQRLATPSAVLALYAERDEARERAEKLAKLDREAATNVESVIAMRTRFNGMPPYVGWKGLGLALAEALDERDKAQASLASYKEEVERLRAVMRETSEYLRKLEGNMLANDADMMLDDCLPPSFHADQIDQALTKETPDA